MNKKDIISWIGFMLAIISLPICLIIPSTLLMVFAPKYLGFLGALLFTSLGGLILDACIGLLLWCLCLATIIKTLKKMGIIKEKRTKH